MKKIFVILIILLGLSLLAEENLVWIEAVPDTIYADNNITYSTVSVKVEDENEQPVVGVQINFSSTIGNMIYHVQTNDDGIAESHLWDSGEVGTAYINASRGGQVLSTTVTILPVVDSPETTIPDLINDILVYPNPFNPATTISFSLEVQSDITIDIYNAKGQLIERVLEDILPKGKYDVSWDAGEKSSSGVYFAKIICGSKEKVKRMILLK